MTSGKDRLREYFENHVREVLETEELRDVARIVDYQRRIRELRRDEGMQILSHLDDASLRPGEYRLATLERVSTPKQGATRTSLLETVKTAARSEQLQAYAWLIRKFGPLSDDDVSALLN
jgi:hypothetical protein